MLSARQKSSNYLEPFKENVLSEYDAVTLTMIYLKVLPNMVSQNSEINFSNATIMPKKYMY